MVELCYPLSVRRGNERLIQTKQRLKLITSRAYFFQRLVCGTLNARQIKLNEVPYEQFRFCLPAMSYSFENDIKEISCFLISFSEYSFYFLSRFTPVNTDR